MEDFLHQGRELARQCDTALKTGVPWEDLWSLIVEHPWYDTMLDDLADFAVRRSGLSVDWRDDIASIARERLTRRLARDPYLNVTGQSGYQRYLPELRRVTRNDCREAVRNVVNVERKRDPSVDPNGLLAAPPPPDVRLDFESLLPQLKDAERTAVVLLDAGHTLGEIADKMRLTRRQAEGAVRRGLAGCGG